MAELSDSDRKRLLKNKSILKITNERIVFTPEFKIHAVKENIKGRGASEIFREAGIELSLFGDTYPKDAIKRWRKVYKSRGENGLRDNLQGKLSSGRPKKKFDPDNIESMRERIAYLEAENDFLKKIRALEEEYIRKNGLK